jgi:hypothetical protein
LFLLHLFTCLLADPMRRLRHLSGGDPCLPGIAGGERGAPAEHGGGLHGPAAVDRLPLHHRAPPPRGPGHRPLVPAERLRRVRHGPLLGHAAPLLPPHRPPQLPRGRAPAVPAPHQALRQAGRPLRPPPARRARRQRRRRPGRRPIVLGRRAVAGRAAPGVGHLRGARERGARDGGPRAGARARAGALQRTVPLGAPAPRRPLRRAPPGRVRPPCRGARRRAHGVGAAGARARARCGGRVPDALRLGLHRREHIPVRAPPRDAAVRRRPGPHRAGHGGARRRRRGAQERGRRVVPRGRRRGGGAAGDGGGGRRGARAQCKGAAEGCGGQGEAGAIRR